MDLTKARADLALATAALARATAALASTETPTVVRAGENLQTVLDKGGYIELEAATWAGSYTLRSETVLMGRVGAKIHGPTGPALVIQPGTHHVHVDELDATSAANEVVSIGENDLGQTTLDQVPTDILFADVRVPSHRNKRAFGIHGSRVTLLNCEVLDCWDPAGRDSMAVYIGNTQGPVTIRGGRYSAGSCVMLVGGDVTRIPHVTPTDLLFEDVELFRPLAWQHDGVNRKVKNLFEIKNGMRVRLRNAILSGCWANGQTGEAIVLTPALDGARTDPPLQSGTVADVLIEDVRISDCGTVANMLGRQYSAYTLVPLSGVVFRRVDAIVSRAQYGGRGQLALIGAEPADVTFDNCDFVGDGSSLIYYYTGNVIDPVNRLTREGGKIGRLTLTGSRCTVGEYGIMLGGYANARNWQASVEVLTVTGNRFSGSTGMKAALPDNTYA